MPDKTLPLILSVLGALAVLAVALFVDVQRASRRGPRWKRRLLTGGLALLAALGIGPGAAHATSADGTQLVAAKRDLAATSEWKRIHAVWAEAAEVASGKRGSFPFDRAGRDKLLADLNAAREAVEILRKQAHLTETEAELLISNFDQYKEKVSGYRPTELKGATCYRPMLYQGGRDTYNLVEWRLPLIEKMAAGSLNEVVAEKVLERFEQDLEFLSDQSKIRDLTPGMRKKAKQLADRARKAIEETRGALKTKAPKPKSPPPTCYRPMPPPDKRSEAPQVQERRQAVAERVIAAQRLSPTAEAKLKPDRPPDRKTCYMPMKVD